MNTQKDIGADMTMPGRKRDKLSSPGAGKGPGDFLHFIQAGIEKHPVALAEVVLVCLDFRGPVAVSLTASSA